MIETRQNRWQMSVPSVLHPFRDTALKYRDKYWKGTLPLPYKEKHPPPTDFTGHRAAYPTVEQIQSWRDRPKQHNIGIRLAGVDEDHEIIGIDVDHYIKGDKQKVGGDQLEELETRLGPLPQTWTSSARTDGRSGIRYFRVPRGLAFRGQVDKDIECISKGYRFAVVWPSVHPDGGTYWWFPPGVKPDKDGRQAWDGVIPDATELPELPQTWIDYLTQGRMRSDQDDVIDMDIPHDQIESWASNTFYGENDTPLCDKMQEKLNRHLKLIEDESTSHDKLINAHYNLIRLAAEGHMGFANALRILDSHFTDITLERGKRTFSEVEGEIFRSKINAFRRVKGQIDQRLAIGAAAVDPLCSQTGACGGAGVVAAPPDDPLFGVPRGVQHPVDSYEMNDRGNAEHIVDQFSSSEIGPSMRWADGYGWIIWFNDENPHWERDELGTLTMVDLWEKIRARQLNYIETALQPDYEQLVSQVAAGGASQATINSMKKAKAKLEKWKKFHEANGNLRNTVNALKSVQSISGVNISVNALDRNSYLLGVANGVVELDASGEVRLRKAQALDYVTMNTGVPWERPSDLAASTWRDYLDTFLPDPDLQRATQIALGHCLIGGNPEKIMIVLKGDPNTGKSTMVAALECALGDYAESVNQSLFQNHKLNPILADALNKRVIICSEFDEHDRLSASQVKRMTGGHDEVRTEKKGSNAKFVGVPQFVPILATNEVPQMAGPDKALENRLYVIPFNVTPSRIKKEYANQIKAICGPAILSWLIDGYVEYRKIGELPRHNLIKKETQAFMAELDEVATFADECLQKVKQESADPYIKPSHMYMRFKQWWIDNSYQMNQIPSQHKFSRRLKALGYVSGMFRVGSETTRFWAGVKFKKTAPVVTVMPNLTTPSKCNTETNKG